MSKANPLLGLIGYDDSDDESDDGTRQNTTAEKSRSVGAVAATAQTPAAASAAIHPAPIAHCPWSACYDETSGFTYYWNQQTNAVTWEAPPEYLLALKLAQQHLHTSGSAEVSAEEWQLYQQALAEKQNSQNKAIAKSSIKSVKKTEKSSQNKENKQKHVKNKRPFNEDDDEKIELITSYHNSDSESNDEADSPVKPVKPIKKTPPAPSIPVEPQKPIVKPNPHKKLKTKSQVVEYGPSLPPNQNYTFPIGPELPKEAVANNKQLEQKPASPKVKTTEEEITTKSDKDATQNDSEDIQDEQQLFMKLKDKAKLLEKLGGEIPQELQKMIEDGSSVENNTPKKEETKTMTDNIDDLLEEIEKKELPKVKSKKMDMFSDIHKTKDNSNQSPKSDRDKTPPLEAKPLFPSIKSIEEAKSLEQNSPRPSPQPSPPPALTDKDVDKKAEAIEKKGFNLYLPDASERFEKVGKKKLRISNSVLPDRKKNEEVAYTTKYSQFIEGFSDERTGLGFSKDEDSTDNPKATPISYGNGLVFTKGETLNEEKKDDNLDELTDLVEAKLQYLTQLQPCVVTPVQEMLIQMQTLAGAFRAGGLSPSYWSRWARRAASELRAHERRAAPPGWSAAFQRAEGRYCYRRESDGFIQWEYPAVASTDMDISTTPPHPGIENKEDPPPPPLPASPPAPPPPPPMAPVAPSGRVRTPPPPSWADPPPPGCDDLPPLPPAEAKQEIGDELASFYSDIAQLEQQVAPNSASSSPPATPPPPTFDREDRKEIVREKEKEKERPKEVKVIKKKSKVKISSSIGLKQKSVSTLVAKWQQVAEEINSD